MSVFTGPVHIDARGGHFTGGDIGHPYLLRALAKCGMNDVIAENFMKTDFPSYGYQVVCNATTLCEDWDGPNPEHPVMSQNHFMLGAAEEWFYQVLAGIQVNACDPIHIEPYFAEQADWVDCETLTPWQREAEGHIRVTVSLERAGRILLCLGGREELLTVEGDIERVV